jgi:glycosyltransferase involved in cell wall biosynthesis
MMLKDENRYILHEDGSKPQYTMLEQNLRRLKSLVGEVYIVDNASTDGSHEVYNKYKDSLINYIRYNDKNMEFDDVRDRKILLDKAKERNMKWLLVIDGDEIYEDATDDYLHSFCKSNSPYTHHVLKFLYVNFWRGRTRFRTDAWNASWFPRLFSINNLVMRGTALHNYSFRFQSGSNISEGNVQHAPVKCLHYGWADWEHRRLKTMRYMQRDMEVNNRTYDEVKRMYSRDLDEDGLKLELGHPEWASEFRDGKIDY